MTIINSLCPQIFGMHKAKLAILLALVGGVSCKETNSVAVRGEIHCLLVGDPGVGKSQLLKCAVRTAERGVLASGVGTSSAGLTVTAVRDSTNGDWALEAGAVVLADGGACCIDEFSCVKEADRTTLHEAMEQQTISVAKAGVVCKLSTKTTILAAMNYRAGVIDLASPLLSRFDLIIELKDFKDRQWDKELFSHLVHHEQTRDMAADDAQQRDSPHSSRRRRHDEQQWNMERLRRYIATVKRKFQPQMSAAAEKLLSAWYQEQRLSAQRDAARTTVRMLESLIRISQAHARLMFRDAVSPEDAQVAIQLAGGGPDDAL
mmetsp:Transcript_5142/g.16367  ORF Transcript_5142/g.16367 Transcript_5142/m.16367 type:complete len:319 (-) Transcript_5142:301-1257(-)